MSTSLFLLLCAAQVTAPLDSGVTELRYTGSLTSTGRNSDGETVKRFSGYWLVDTADDGSRKASFLVDERGGSGWAWPERFGQISITDELQPTSPLRMQLLYDHQGNLNPIKLPVPVFEFAARLKPEANWVAGGEGYEVAPKLVKVADRSCWQVDVSTNFGRKRTLWIEENTPLVVALEERVFMGQGDEFSLRMQLESAETIADAPLARTQAVLNLLLTLKNKLQRKDNDVTPELNETQLEAAKEVLAKIEQAAEETPFSRLASVMNRDVKLQLQRSDDIVLLAKKFVGQNAPEFTLKLLDQKTVVEPLADKEKITVLHFWEYQGEPLVEPYGQVGYLDYLYSRRRKLGVQVFGVAVDERFGEKQNSSPALRSANKLKSFMNLGYPIAVDNGEILGDFGDPRRVGAKLPLWVVITPDGKIAHYSVGFYKINPDEGLRALDEVLVELIKKQRASEKGE